MAKTNLVAELFYSGTWHTVLAYTRDPALINRERPPGSEPTPSSVSLTLQGIHNPKNPLSPLWGVAGQNTPIRLKLGTDVRFYGEVASWAPGRSLGYNGAGRGDAWTAIQVTGILRRLGQGAEVLRSALFRSISGVTPDAFTPTEYWPMEDGSESTSIASAIAGRSSGTVSGTAAFASSGPLGSAPVLQASTGFTAAFPVSSYTDTGRWALAIAVNIPVEPALSTTLLTVPVSGGTLASWRLSFVPGSPSEIRWEGYNSAGSAVAGRLSQQLVGSPGGPTEDGFYGHWWMITVGSEQDGTASLAWVGASDGTTASSGPHAQIGNVSEPLSTHQPISGPIAISVDSSLDGIGIGHLSVFTDTSFDFLQWGFFRVRAVSGWLNEQGHDRMERLCFEEDITVTVEGSESQPMGAQPRETLVNLFAEIERTDDGMVFEPRTSYGLVYRTGRERRNRSVVLALNYALKEVAPPLVPVLDDLATRNDVTVQRLNGASARAVKETGALSVLAPPDGIGKYTTQVDVNTSTDAVLTDHASWWLHKFTQDGVRYERVTVYLDALSASQATAAALVDVDDVITIDNLPTDETLVQARLQVTGGYSESIESHGRTITFNCVLASTYDTAKWGSDALGSRFGARSTVLAEDLTATETAADVTATGEVWITTASHPSRFPFDVTIGGLSYSCTAITGTTPNYTLTLVRLGSDKTHTTGDAVTVTKTGVYGI